MYLQVTEYLVIIYARIHLSQKSEIKSQKRSEN